jgi:hypothetical protein
MTLVNLNSVPVPEREKKDPKRLEAKWRHRINRNTAAEKAKLSKTRT